MRATGFKRAFAALAAFVAVCAFAASVFSAQYALKPPVWVGVYTTAGKVGLKWAPAPGAAKYKVLRSVTPGKGYGLVVTTNDSSYIDAEARPGETYYYVLKSVASDGRESAVSDERYVTVPKVGAAAAVAPPEWVGALIEKKLIKLAWVPSPSANALAYNVYRSKQKDKGFQLIGSTQDSTFADSDVKEGETYYYALTTLDREFKETGFGEVREVKFVMGAEVPEVKPGPGPEGEEAEALPDRLSVKPTKSVGYIMRGKDDEPLLSPTDVAVAPDGTIAVSDTGNSRIQLFKRTGEYLRVIGGPGVDPGRFQNLLGVTVDDKGFIYGVDANVGKIQKFDPMGALVMMKLMADDGKLIAEDLGLKEPVKVFGVVKVVVSPDGEMYAIDNYNDCVEVFSSNGRYVKTFGGHGLKEGKFQGPTFATLDKDGRLYVSDCFNARVQVFDKGGKFIRSFGSYGNVLGCFARPKGLYVDNAGRVYVADSMLNVIQVFDQDGKVLFALGDEKGKQMDVGTPNGIVMDGGRRIYMVEKLVNRVQIRQVGE